MQIGYNELSRRYKLSLMSLTEIPLGEIAFYDNLEYSPGLTSISELTFNLNSHYENSKGELVPTPYYKDLEADTLVVIDDENYFYINSCSEKTESGFSIKEIHAFSREYELALKSFNNYEPETERFLYFKFPVNGLGFPWPNDIPTTNKLNTFLTADIDSDGASFGLFNEIEKITTWKLKKGTNGLPPIPIALATQTRGITTSETNLLELMKEIQEAWKCYFTYDTKNRTIEIHELKELNTVPSGMLSDENFIISLTRELKKEDIKTRLFLYNKDGIGVIAEKMAHGQPYIEDYAYFRNNTYMSAALQNALNGYFANLNLLREDVETIWGNLKENAAEREATQDLINEAEQNIINPTSLYEYYKNIRDGYTNEDTGEVLYEGRALSEAEIEAFAQASIDLNKWANVIKLYSTGQLPPPNYPRSLAQLDTEREIYLNELKALKSGSLMSVYFKNFEIANSLSTSSLEKEMEPFIRDATYQSDSIEDADDLYNQGIEILKEISRPGLQFSMDVTDFLSLVEFEKAWNLIKLGQILRVTSSTVGFVDDVILLRYNHNPDAQSLTLEFSNNLHLKSDTNYIAELLAKSASVASSVSFNSSFWNSGGSGSGYQSNVFGLLYANEIQAKKIIAGEIEALVISTQALYAARAEIDEIVAGKIIAGSLIVGALSAKYAQIDFANITNAAINNLIVNTAFITSLTASTAFINSLTAQSAFIAQLDANYANIATLTAGTGIIRTALINDLIASDGYIAELKVSSLQVPDLDANKITTGTIVADRIVIRNLENPEQSLIFAINNISGALQAVQGNTLNGEVLTERSISADRIIAASITATEIAAKTITALEIATGSLTSASGVFGAISASDIQTGTLDAIKVNVVNLTANSIRTGILLGATNNFYLNLDNGYFNFGDRVVSDISGIRINLGDNATKAEDYIANASQEAINSIQLGGLNLIRRSNNFYLSANQILNLDGWKEEGAWSRINEGFNTTIYTSVLNATIDNWLGYSSSKILMPTTSQKAIVLQFEYMVTNIDLWDTKYPARLELYDNAGVKIGGLDLFYDYGGPISITNGSWNRFVALIDLETDIINYTAGKTLADAFYFGVKLVLARNGTIFFRKPKIEFGNILSVYSLSPDDINDDIILAKIDSIDSTIANITTHYKNLAAEVESFTSDPTLIDQLTTLTSTYNAIINEKQISLNDGYISDADLNNINARILLYEQATINIRKSMTDNIIGQITNISDDLSNLKTGFENGAHFTTITSTTAWQDYAAGVATTSSVEGVARNLAENYTTTLQMSDKIVDEVGKKYLDLEGQVKEVATYFVKDMNGLTITNTDSPFSTTLGTEDLSFKTTENGVTKRVASIGNQAMKITNVFATKSITLGVHRLEKWSDDLTVGRWVGPQEEEF